MPNRTQPITESLEKIRAQIEKHAVRFGLDFYPVVFEVCDYDTINILAAQGGFPNRYPHWRFGMDYDQLSKGHTYGTQKIYEMVINTNPCYAYLLQANNLVDQKIVMAHVYGHADFFKNNMWFSHTNKKMMDVMANNGAKIRRYMEKYGHERVEKFIDRLQSFENLLDMNQLFETQALARKREKQIKLAQKERRENKSHYVEGRSQALNSFISSKERRKADRRKKPKQEEGEEPLKLDTKLLKIPEKPTRDIMDFLARYAPIEEWEADILGMLREEAYYFLPQRITKIMNEGWASYWHSRIMTEKTLSASEIVDFADHHSSVMYMSPKQINPYKIGIELFRDIEYRWNRGMFGKEFNECENLMEKENWNMKLNQGMKKIFEVRRTHNDITFIDEFLTPEFCQRQKLFTYKYNPRTSQYEIDSLEFAQLKAKLLNQLSNFGSPVIEVVDGNFNNRGELLMKHDHFGVDLDMNMANDTLRNIYSLWKRPVNLQTNLDGRPLTFVFDGRDFKPLS